MEYYINDDNIHMIDSYKISKYEFKDILNRMRSKFTNNVLKNRSNYSLICEWSIHNLLYNFNIYKSRTKDTDLNHPQPLYIKIIYNIFGPIAWLFIK